MENGKGVRKRDSRIQVGNSRIYEEKQSVAQIARDFGIRESLIPRWKKAFWGDPRKPPRRRTSQKEEALCTSERGIERELRKERDILKKAHEPLSHTIMKFRLMDHVRFLDGAMASSLKVSVSGNDPFRESGGKEKPKNRKLMRLQEAFERKPQDLWKGRITATQKEGFL